MASKKAAKKPAKSKKEYNSEPISKNDFGEVEQQQMVEEMKMRLDDVKTLQKQMLMKNVVPRPPSLPQKQIQGTKNAVSPPPPPSLEVAAQMEQQQLMDEFQMQSNYAKLPQRQMQMKNTAPFPPSAPPFQNMAPPAAKGRQARISSFSKEEKNREESEEEEEDDGAEESQENFFRPTAEMLQKGKSLLKSSDGSRPKIFLDRSKLFDSLDSPYFYPLQKMKDIFTVDNATVEFLDLTGVEQLTDVFFAAIQFLHKNSLFCKNLLRITLQGCSHITDLGVKFMSETFPRLQTVSLLGCAVTEKSVSRLLAKCDKLEFLNLTCTDVGVVSLPADSDIVCSLLVEGCPLLSPPYSVYQPSRSSLTTRNDYFKDLKIVNQWNVSKVLIINTTATRISILNSLVSQKVSCLQTESPLICHRGFQPNKTLSVNLFECFEEMAVHLVSDHSIFILPYNADGNIKDICLGIELRLLTILSKVENAMVILVCCAGKTKKPVSSSEVVAGIKQSLETRKKALNQILANLYNKLYSQNESIDYAEQIRMGNVYKLLSGIETVELIGEVTVEESQKPDVLQSAIITGISRIKTLQPMYTVMPVAFTKITKAIVPKPGLHLESQVISELQAAHKSDLGHNYRTYKKALHLMHLAV